MEGVHGLQGCLGQMVGVKEGGTDRDIGTRKHATMLCLPKGAHGLNGPWFVPVGISMNARMKGFTAEFCTVAGWSNLFTLTEKLNVMADKLNHCNPLFQLMSLVGHNV